MAQFKVSNIRRLTKKKSLKLIDYLAKDTEVDAEEVKLCYAFVWTFNEDIAPGNIYADTVEEYIEKWFKKYLDGWLARPSLAEGYDLGTFHDNGLNLIINKKLGLDEADMLKFIEAHRLLMKYENLLGNFLEEFLAINLKSHGYYCAWGSTMKSIDFFSKDKLLLQVKNSDNSENSSSKAIRGGRKIKHWFRRYSKKEDSFNWDKLNKLVGLKNENKLTEEKFRIFIEESLNENPKSAFVYANSTWK